MLWDPGTGTHDRGAFSRVICLPLAPKDSATSARFCPQRRGEGKSKSRVEGRLGSRSTWRLGGLSKSVVSRVLVGVIPFRVLITLLITDLLSPLGL